MATASKTPPKLLLGTYTASLFPPSYHSIETPDEVNSFLGAFAAHGHTHIDTSRMYGDAEARLGAVGAGKRFSIKTKVMSWQPGFHAKGRVLAEIDASLAALRLEQLEIDMLHVPDRTTPFTEPCEAMDEAYRAGKIKAWGLCSYTAAEVEQICGICEQRGLVKPSVYEGHYNLLVRGMEEDLLPVLRKHGMAFHAFSPAGGGFFAGNLRKPVPGGRFDNSNPTGQMWVKHWDKPAIHAAADKALEVAARHGISGHEAALRWTVYHGVLDKEHDDGVILGASSTAQLESNLDAIEKGPLPKEVIAALETAREEVKYEVPPHIF
ncbi:aldo/keto reductase [Xylariomycetidae sp. FL2044]|nr:aldo/keto reductase [Xylariomycetidae sp. FL2044]